MSKNNGGLRVKDLEIINKALLIKWMWLWTNTDGWWEEETMNTGNNLRPWEINGLSAFWKNVGKLKEISIVRLHSG
jgi:hypothetical protein